MPELSHYFQESKLEDMVKSVNSAKNLDDKCSIFFNIAYPINYKQKIHAIKERYNFHVLEIDDNVSIPFGQVCVICSLDDEIREEVFWLLNQFGCLKNRGVIEDNLFMPLTSKRYLVGIKKNRDELSDIKYIKNNLFCFLTISFILSLEFFVYEDGYEKGILDFLKKGNNYSVIKKRYVDRVKGGLTAYESYNAIYKKRFFSKIKIKIRYLYWRVKKSFSIL